ncbi:PREDICTED: breast carcinoma-amplified sequence 1 [Nanorana parkeri]|uniref:breast carcinoma-amplified sequence 1 n=1 Tax=Nanorana parkeri TaxID=125878 RepID=UPI0008543FC3|nr:PREDICTED: breast carcinoma-amplified sequence 1 [Nanorana parkeri]
MANLNISNEINQKASLSKMSIKAFGPRYVKKSKATIRQENVISSSQKTIIISPIPNGTDAKPPAPQAKSKFSMTISRPAPGLTAFQPNGPENGGLQSGVRVEEPALVQTQNNAPVIVKSSVTPPPTVLTTDGASLSLTNNDEVDSAPPKPREVSIFHKLFKTEKKVQFEEPVQSGVPENQEVVITLNQNGGLQSAPPNASLQIQNVDKGNRAAADGQRSETASVPVGPETSAEATQTSPQPEVHPVMSFFKTLVSPNKPVPKSEEETKPDAGDKKKENGGLRKSSSKKEKGKGAAQQTPETEVKGQKKADSSKSSTLGRLFRPKPTASAKEAAAARPRLFWRKSLQGDPQPSKIQENGVEEPAAVPVNVSPEPALTPDTNPPDVGVQPQEEEKVEKEAPPRPLPFWRKSFKADPQPPKVQENVAVQQPVVSVSVEQPVPEQPAVPEPKPTEADKPSPDSEKPVKEASARPVPFWKKVAVEQPVVSVSLNTEKTAPEPIVAPEVQQADAVIAPPENEKPVKEAASRPLPFWKSFKADPQPPKIPENSPPEEPVTVQLTETSSSEPDSQSSKPDSKAKASPVTEGKSQQGKKADEGKNSKPKIMMFFKQLSVMGDPNNGTPEEVNGKISPTLDITDGVEVGKSEKTVVTAVVEPPPPPQKAKENPKEKKASSEKLAKQESRESPEAAASSQAQAVEAAPAQNGAESSKDGQIKKVEKRQSLGSFFKGIGPKRLIDAEVQTDPVSILPAEKAK